MRRRQSRSQCILRMYVVCATWYILPVATVESYWSIRVPVLHIPVPGTGTQDTIYCSMMHVYAHIYIVCESRSTVYDICICIPIVPVLGVPSMICPGCKANR